MNGGRHAPMWGLAIMAAFATLFACGCRSVEQAGPFFHQAHELSTAFDAVQTRASPSGEPGDSGIRYRATEPIRLLSRLPIAECVVSFNADVPPGSGIVAEVSIEGPEQGWLRIASWGAVPEGWPSNTECKGGFVAIDELILEEPIASIWVRAVAFETGGPVKLHRLDVITTSQVLNRRIEASTGALRKHEVPFHANASTDPELRSRLCSPTSLNMLLNDRSGGIRHADVVERIYSERFDLYGVWPRAIQTAWTFGVPGRLARFADWDEARHHLDVVGPIAISITAKPGEVHGMPYESDSGHILVLAGLTAEGDAIVIDPALRHEEDARRVYRSEDLTRVWLRRKRGTAYVLFQPDSAPGP